MKKVILLGFEYQNTLGVVRSFGKEGFFTIAALWGPKTNIVAKSKYVNKLILGQSIEDCFYKLVEFQKEENVILPIIPTCDVAAVFLEQHSKQLQGRFICGGIKNSTLYSLQDLQIKALQVRLAEQSGFNVPKSIEISTPNQIEKLLDFDVPYMIKPLASYRGTKSDLTVVRDPSLLYENVAKVLSHTPKVLIQEFIEKDYELSILGCAFKDGRVYIPIVEDKLVQYPPNVGLECLAKLEELTDSSISIPITNLIQRINYVGLFSVEMMHSKLDGKVYFTEVNLRNDGANFLLVQHGINLPLMHYNDLLNVENSYPDIASPKYYVWETHHLQLLLSHEISLKQWFHQIRVSRGGILYDKLDKIPFFYYFIDSFLQRVHLRKIEFYK